MTGDGVVADGPLIDLDEVEPSIRDGLLRLLAVDHATLALGVDRIATGPEWLELRMTVSAQQSNGHGISHGGVLYTVADSAAGLSANSAPGESGWVTASASVDYVAPARLGDMLVARCRLVSEVEGRVKIFVTEVAADGQPVAVVQSRMRRQRGIGS